MQDAFDPYHRWLGISPKDQPPDHYRLLAIDRFEQDPDVIADAADRQMAYLRTHQAGRNAQLATKLLNEVAAARVTLLSAQRRPAYDRQLQEQLDQRQSNAVRRHEVGSKSANAGALRIRFSSAWTVGLAAVLGAVVIGVLAAPDWGDGRGHDSAAPARDGTAQLRPGQVPAGIRIASGDTGPRSVSDEPGRSVALPAGENGSSSGSPHPTAPSTPPTSDPAEDPSADSPEASQSPLPGTGDGSLSDPENQRQVLRHIRAALVTVLAEHGSQRTVVGGVVVDPSGVVVAPFHALDGARQVEVRLPTGQPYRATGYLVVDPRRDLILFRIDAPRPLASLQVANNTESIATARQVGELAGGAFVDSAGKLLGLSTPAKPAEQEVHTRWMATGADIRAMLGRATDEAQPLSELDLAARQADTEKNSAGESRSLLSELQVHDGPVTGLALAPDGTYLASCSTDGRICVINIAENRVATQLGSQGVWYHDLGVSPDGKYLVAGCSRGETQLQVWHSATGDPVKQVACEQRDVLALCVSPDGGSIAAGHPRGALTLRGADATRLHQHATLFAKNRDTDVTCVTFAVGSSLLIAGTADGRLTSYRLGRSGGSLAASRTAHGDKPVRALVHLSGTQVVSVGDDGQMRFWADAERLEPRSKDAAVSVDSAGVTALAIDSRGRRLATGGKSGRIRIWDARSGKALAILPGHSSGTTQVLFYDLDRKIISAGAGGKVCIWEIPDAGQSGDEAGGGPPGTRPAKAVVAAGEESPAASTDGELLSGTRLPVTAQAPDAARITAGRVPAERHPVPTPAEQAAIRRQHGIAEKLLAAAQEDTRIERLHQANAHWQEYQRQGKQDRLTPPEGYVRLNAALRLAAAAGNEHLAESILAELSRRFQVDEVRLASEVYTLLAAGSLGPDQKARLIDHCVRRARLAMYQERLDLTAELLSAAKSAVGTAVGPHRQLLERCAKELALAHELRESYQEQRQTLRENPEDAAAQHAVGLYLCYVQGKWSEGMAKLAMSSDARWSKAAAIDWSRPASREARYKLARRWQALSEQGGVSPAESTVSRLSARHWYGRVAAAEGEWKSSGELVLQKLQPPALIDRPWLIDRPRDEGPR